MGLQEQSLMLVLPPERKTFSTGGSDVFCWQGMCSGTVVVNENQKDQSRLRQTLETQGVGFQNMCFFPFWALSKGALGGLFGTLVAPGATPGLWERTLGHFWLSFVTFWGALLASLGTLVADIGCLWASFGPSLADFGELWGSSWTL